MGDLESKNPSWLSIEMMEFLHVKVWRLLANSKLDHDQAVGFLVHQLCSALTAQIDYTNIEDLEVLQGWERYSMAIRNRIKSDLAEREKRPIKYKEEE